MVATTPAAAEPSITQEQLGDLVDQLVARALPDLLEVAEERIHADALRLADLDVEKLLATTVSDTFDEVIPALFEARREFSKLTKNKENPHFGSSYADLAQVIAVTEDGLASHGLALIQSPLYLKWSGQLEMFLQTRIWHVKSLQWLQAWWWVDPAKRDPQGFGSAMTYGRRYPAQTLLGLAGEDDDGNAAAAPRNQRQAAPAPPPTVEVSDLERDAIIETIMACNDVDAVRAKWNELRDAGKLTDELKAKLNFRATELTKAAAQAEQAATAAETTQPPEEPPRRPRGRRTAAQPESDQGEG